MIVSLMFMVSALIIYFQFIQPAYEDAQTVKSELRSEQGFLEKERGTIDDLQKLITKYQGQVGIQDAVSERLPIGEDLAGAIAQLSGLIQQSSLVLESISVSVVAPQTTSLAGKAAVTASNFQASLQKPTGSINFRAKLSGSYDNLKGLIHFLETNVRLFDVKLISIQPANVSAAPPPSAGQGKAAGAVTASQDFFDYEIMITAYYQAK